MNTTEKHLIKKMEKMIGYVPVGTVDLLHILIHPDLIDLTEQYVKEGKSNE